jgi:hypothetical protein
MDISIPVGIYAAWNVCSDSAQYRNHLIILIANARSPIFSSFTDLLDGITTIRAFSAEHRFLDELHEQIDLMTQVRSHPLTPLPWQFFILGLINSFQDVVHCMLNRLSQL